MSIPVTLPERLVAASRLEPPAFATILEMGKDPSAFVGRRQGGNMVALLRPAAAGLRIERLDAVESVGWDEVSSIDMSLQRFGGEPVRTARVRFRSGPSLDLVEDDGRDPGDLPMSLELAGPVLIRVERLRLFVAAVAASAGLAPRDRDTFHRGGRGVPLPEVASRRSSPPWWATPALLVLSVAVLVLLVPDMTWAGAIGVMVALLWHEAGHAVAMRLAGMRVRRVLVIPGIGMGTVPDRPYETRWADSWIALAGPFTGVPVAVAALLLLSEPPPDAVRWALFVSIALGLLNLAPIMPLDGGRVVIALISGLSPTVRAAIAFTPVAVVLAIAARSGSALLAVGPVLIVVWSIAMTHVALRRQAVHAWMLRAAAPPAAIRRALRDVTASFDGAASEDVDGGIPPDPLTSGRAAIVLAGYAALVLALVWLSARLAPVIPEMGFLQELGLIG